MAALQPAQLRQQMRQFLALDMVGLALVVEIDTEMASMKDQLATTNLKNSDGQMTAVELQGKLKGINRVLDIMSELASKETPHE